MIHPLFIVHTLRLIHVFSSVGVGQLCFIKAEWSTCYKTFSTI